MRQSKIHRQTSETDITIQLFLDGSGQAEVATGIGFLDHMLTLLARHGGLDLSVSVRGDLNVDDHHTVEDVGIVLGQALKDALGEKRGISRFGHAVIPMDEALASSAVDISGRPWLSFNARFSAEKVGGFSTQMTGEFFRALAVNAGLTLHLSCVTGQNDHHIIEALFKSFARSLAQACAINSQAPNQIPSTKGLL
ncbi:MAG: imidazoleglycerol-phosphate dehydratase HisB [Clostridiaceae bacterium]|jgi:imidazoleglycerol-phosphate dehydratase|nr:imidazoleglycerol-phosphate dehydratase HisB [Eubacteriales bacterium]NLV47075.1 imidazoleglycerol-phosphate dehydratase HisB [Clostridiaceae bacterium]